MMNSAKELAGKSSCVTSLMVDAAISVLRKLGIGQLSRKIDNRDVVHEMLSAVFKLVAQDSEAILRDEVEWSEFFDHCQVVVKNAEVGQTLLRKGMEDAKSFEVLIGGIVHSGAIVVNLRDYPGVALFSVRPEEGQSKRKPPAGK